jgi:ATP-dependent Clp protease protease subunit
MNKLLQLIASNKASGQPLKIEQKGQTADVYLYDVIGADYYGGISAKELVPQLNALDVTTINLHINSPGGDVFDARAIAQALAGHKANKIAHIDALAASAATYIATACDEIHMADGAFFMIHNAWTLAMGNANDLDEVSNLLRKIDGSINKDYQTKTGKNEQEIAKLMDATTWFTAEEAKAAGFIDKITTAEKQKPNNRWNLSAYGNAPQSLINSAKDDGADEAIAAHKKKLAMQLDLIIATAA